MNKSRSASILVNLQWPCMVILLAGAIDYQFYGASWPELGGLVTFLGRLFLGLQVFGYAVAFIGWNGTMSSPHIAANPEARASLIRTSQTSTWFTKEHYTHFITVAAIFMAGHQTLAIIMYSLGTVFRLWISWRKGVYLKQNA